MSDKLIMEIYVDFNPNNISELQEEAGGVVMIPFGGTASGEIFNGIILPGGVDTQRLNINGVRHMSARYMLEGTDNAGEKCKIFIENNGYFTNDDVPSPFKTVPTFKTDSRTLATYLHRNVFRGEGYPTDGSVVIKFYELGAGD